MSSGVRAALPTRLSRLGHGSTGQPLWDTETGVTNKFTVGWGSGYKTETNDMRQKLVFDSFKTNQNLSENSFLRQHERATFLEIYRLWKVRLG